MLCREGDLAVAGVFWIRESRLSETRKGCASVFDDPTGRDEGNRKALTFLLVVGAGIGLFAMCTMGPHTPLSTGDSSNSMSRMQNCVQQEVGRSDGTRGGMSASQFCAASEVAR